MKILDSDKIKEKVITKLKTIQDAELPINIYDLGLIYKIDIEEKDNNLNINIDMTVINSRCASTKSFTDLIKSTVESIDEIKECVVKFVFSPKWEVTKISKEGLEQLRKGNSSL
jgi:metal-sulfur cluster biosynthetic enzyme